MAEENPEVVVIAAYNKLAVAKSYHMTMTTKATMTMYSQDVLITVDSNMDVLRQPLLYKNIMNFSSNAVGKERHESVIKYGEKVGGRFIFYKYSNGKWERLDMSGWEYNPFENSQAFVQAIKRADLVSEAENSAVYQITADGKMLREVLTTGLIIEGMWMSVSSAVINSLGDLTYNITIDKATGNISSMDIDFSELMKTFGNQRAGQRSKVADERLNVTEMLSSMQVQMSFTLSQFNSVQPFAIPDEAR